MVKSLNDFNTPKVHKSNFNSYQRGVILQQNHVCFLHLTLFYHREWKA